MGCLLAALAALAGCAHSPQPLSGARDTPSPEFIALQTLLGDAHKEAGSYSELQAAYHSQPDFACRQPAYAAYFQQAEKQQTSLQQISPQQTSPQQATPQQPTSQQATGATNKPLACANTLPLLMWQKEGAWQVHWLDTARVRSVHLLFAGQSSAPASRFGHVALRLVICPDLASAQAQSSEACDINLTEHLVLGFQAHVDDSQIQLRRAIFGGYHTRLMANRFFDTYEQYTTAEFRDLYSLPLLMTAQEQQTFLHSLVQLHWSHESDYRFFTNNCATLLQDTLASLWPRYEQAAAQDARFLRPDRFFNAMQHSGLLAGGLLANPAQAKRDGYWFSSNETAYRTAAQLLASAMEKPFFSSLETYARTPAQQRIATITADTSLRTAMATNPRLRATPLLLEEWALLQAERRLLQAATQLWEIKHGNLVYSGDTPLSASDQTLIEACLTNPLQAQLTPPSPHSGIPAQPTAATAPVTPCSHTQKQQLNQLLLRELPRSSADWRQLLASTQELAATLANLAQLRYATQAAPNLSLNTH